MPTFITLFTFTSKAFLEIKDMPVLFERITEAYGDAGARVVGFYRLIGRYDALMVAEVPDAETVAKLEMLAASWGYMRPETMRAFDMDEFRRLLADIT